jgi:hypothetical protein
MIAKLPKLIKMIYPTPNPPGTGSGSTGGGSGSFFSGAGGAGAELSKPITSISPSLTLTICPSFIATVAGLVLFSWLEIDAVCEYSFSYSSYS